MLTPRTARHFDRDPETNQVLWFSGPPIDIAKPAKPQHSLTYLHFLAMKKKGAAAEADAEGKTDDNDNESRKKAKTEAQTQRAASEILGEIYESVFGRTTAV